MRPYEIMIILDADAEESAITVALDRYLAVITQAGGTIDNVDVWGKRHMAYPIKKKADGFYVVVEFTAAPADAKELDRQLGLSEAVLRTKLLRRDPPN
ncbi:MAG: 30S ribosomal protein S6 [Bifidobacteriaceae bacterium]|jgi:small subunit ribosomal protein S6|nr:30S ribosomal protein S6 [Bifidobacteriaceae bacterium]